MTTTQSKETQARQKFARRIEHGHLTRDELWAVAELVRQIGVLAEHHDTSTGWQAGCWRNTAREYRRLVPEGGERHCESHRNRESCVVGGDGRCVIASHGHGFEDGA